MGAKIVYNFDSAKKIQINLHSYAQKISLNLSRILNLAIFYGLIIFTFHFYIF